MQALFDILHRLNFSMLPHAQESLKGLSPYFSNIQNSFDDKAVPFYQWLLLILGIIGCAVMINAVVKIKMNKTVATKSSGGGQELFESTLAHLELSAFDRSLLKEVARETRLRHPSVFLLSPDLFKWSQKIWVAEKGAEHVTDEKLKQMDTIGYKLFGATPLPAEPVG